MRRRAPTFLPPWWVALLLAPVSYGLLAIILPRWPTANPYLHLVLTSTAPALAPFLAAGFVLIAAALGLARCQRRRLLDQQRDIESLRHMRWQDFEQLVGEYYRRQGWRVQETGGGGADGGIDLVLKRNGEAWLVQCKRFAKSAISVKIVRELLGVVASERATGGIFITTSTFTREAEGFAKGQKLELVDGETLLHRIKEVQAKRGITLAPPTPLLHEASSSTVFQSPLSSLPPTEPLIVHCPQCGSQMIRRTAKQGAKAGSAFWGCSNYPGCRGIRPI